MQPPSAEDSRFATQPSSALECNHRRATRAGQRGLRFRFPYGSGSCSAKRCHVALAGVVCNEILQVLPSFSDPQEAIRPYQFCEFLELQIVDGLPRFAQHHEGHGPRHRSFMHWPWVVPRTSLELEGHCHIPELAPELVERVGLGEQGFGMTLGSVLSQIIKK